MWERRKIIIWILVIAFGLAGVWGYSQYNEKNNYRTFLENQYLNEFYSLLNSVEDIEALLAKSMVTQSGEQQSLLLTETWKNANLAQNNLSRLPISHLALNETSKFLSQLGILLMPLKQTINNKDISNKQWEDLERLHNNNSYLVRNLQKLHQDMIQNGGITFGDIEKEILPLERVSDNIIEDSFTRVEGNDHLSKTNL